MLQIANKKISMIKRSISRMKKIHPVMISFIMISMSLKSNCCCPKTSNSCSNSSIPTLKKLSFLQGSIELGFKIVSKISMEVLLNYKTSAQVATKSILQWLIIMFCVISVGLTTFGLLFRLTLTKMHRLSRNLYEWERNHANKEKIFPLKKTSAE